MYYIVVSFLDIENNGSITMAKIEADWVDEFLLDCLFGENLEELE